MTFLNENFGKELQRMAELAGIKLDSLNENISKTLDIKSKEENKKIIKEDETILTEMPLFGNDLDTDTGDDNIEDKGEDSSSPVGELNKDLKAAMVLNNISQYEAVLLDLYTKYNPKTKLHKPESEGGEEGTVYTKTPINKLPGASAEIARLSRGGFELTPDEVQKLNSAGVSDEEISAAIEFQRKSGFPKKRLPVTFGEKPESKSGMKDISSEAKWALTHKNYAIISYKNDTLTNTGKQQLEFLSRMLSDRPLSPNGDENVDIEQALLNTIYKKTIRENSEKIIRDFYNRALIPVLARRLKRNQASPSDAQFDMLKTAGIDKAIDMTVKGMYNKTGEFKNYGAWFMTTASNEAIDQLKPITDYKFDIKHVSDMLSAHNGPFEIESTLDPKDAYGNYDSVRKSEKGPYYKYIYNEPLNAIHDFQAGYDKTSEGNKFSPLAANYLKNKGDFYTSTLKDTPESLSQTVVQPSFDEKINVVPMDDVLKFAAKKVDDVLANIAGQMTLDTYNAAGKIPEGEEVRISRNIESYPTFTKGEYYKVIGKEMMPPPTGGPKKNYYKLLDNNGDEKLVAAYDTTAKKAIEKKVVAKLRDTKDATAEILRLLLQYGSMRLVYTKTVYYPSPDGGWIKRDVGDIALRDKRTNDIIIPFASKNSKDRYSNLDSVPMRWEWFSKKKNVDNVNEILIDEISNVANKRGFKLPSEYFDENNKPLYKMKGTNPNLKQKTMDYINEIKSKLENYFGVEGNDVPIIKKNRDELNALINNYTKSVEARDKGLAENHIRKAIREMLAAKLLK